MSEDISNVDVEQNVEISHMKKDIQENKDNIKAHVDDCSKWRENVMDKFSSVERKGMIGFFILIIIYLASQNEEVQKLINWVL